jgi:hypothetical protein
MATKMNTDPSQQTTPKTRKKRVLKPISAEAQALLDEAKEQNAKAKSLIKEAKAIGKIISCIESVGPWGMAKIEDALASRRAALTK